MLHFTSNAPLEVARNVVHGAGWAEGVDGSTVIHVQDRYAIGVINALDSLGCSVTPGRPKAAIADPTFAMAAARIDRPIGGSSAPAAIAIW